MKLMIFDPAMCCSSGVCGPSVDQSLVRLAADISFLQKQGVEVQRFGLAHQPDAFTSRPQILAEMGPEAEHLPIFMAGDELKAKGRYPDRAELAGWFGIQAEDPAARRQPLKIHGG